MPSEEQRATCANCGHAIIWYFDRDDDARATPYGFWYDAERLTEACGGPDSGVAHDDDLWHEPEAVNHTGGN